MTEFFRQRILRGFVRRLNNLKVAALAKRVVRHSPPASGQPVVFFKASTGIDDLSWNSGFHLLASWALRLQGVPVVYFACQAGMSRCVLGTNRHKPHKAPPCKSCVYQTRTLYTGVPSWPLTSHTSLVNWFTFDRDRELERAVADLDLEQLCGFEWTISSQSTRNPGIASLPDAPITITLPLGELCLPGLRWILRRHHLDDDQPTRFLI